MVCRPSFIKAQILKEVRTYGVLFLDSSRLRSSIAPKYDYVIISYLVELNAIWRGRVETNRKRESRYEKKKSHPSKVLRRIQKR